VNEIVRRADGQLAGRTVAILVESDYVEPELSYYLRRFAEEGAHVRLLTRLWGQPSITFTDHEYRAPLQVDGDLEAVDDETLAGFDALIVPGGMASDRLRYSENVKKPAPAVTLLQRAFAQPAVLKGIICHGMWLVSPIPKTVRGRRVTCHNNLIGDVRNMGAKYTDQDVVVDGDLVTGRTALHCHLFARTIIDLLVARLTLANSSPGTTWVEPSELPVNGAQPANGTQPTNGGQPANGGEPANGGPAKAGRTRIHHPAWSRGARSPR
jgi:protease I